MGITKQAVSGWERTGVVPKDRQEELAKVLGVDATDLKLVSNAGNLCVQIAEAIKMSGLQKKQFAKAIGVTNAYLGGWLKQSGGKPHTRFIERMANLVGVTVEEFFQLGL